MSTLYEIDRAIMNCCNQETGEMIDQEALDAWMMQNRRNGWIPCRNVQTAAIRFKRKQAST